jgi:hypothetical protein
VAIREENAMTNERWHDVTKRKQAEESAEQQAAKDAGAAGSGAELVADRP